MVRSILLGVATFAVALATSGPVSAQTTSTRAKHPDYHHAKRPRPVPEGRQITVHKAIPSYLTLGPGAAEVGYGNNYVTDTFNQPSPVEGTFAGYRGRERLIDQYGVPGAALFRF